MRMGRVGGDRGTIGVRILRTLVIVLPVIVLAVLAQIASADTGPTLSPTSLTLCVRTDGGQGGDRGSVSMIAASPVDFSWKDGKPPDQCAKNEQRVSWSGGAGGGSTGATGAT